MGCNETKGDAIAILGVLASPSAGAGLVGIQVHIIRMENLYQLLNPNSLHVNQLSWFLTEMQGFERVLNACNLESRQEKSYGHHWCLSFDSVNPLC